MTTSRRAGATGRGALGGRDLQPRWRAGSAFVSCAAMDRLPRAVRFLQEGAKVVAMDTSDRPHRVAARNGKGLVFIDLDGVWAFEAAGRLTFVHSHLGRLDLDVTLANLERSLPHGFARVHRRWLINVRLARTLERDGGEVQVLVGPQRGAGGIRVAIARSHAGTVRDLLLRDTIGIRVPRRAPARRRQKSEPR